MGVTYDYATLDAIRTRLRNLVQQSFQNHLYATAIFYADKLVHMPAFVRSTAVSDSTLVLIGHLVGEDEFVFFNYLIAMNSYHM